MPEFAKLCQPLVEPYAARTRLTAKTHSDPRWQKLTYKMYGHKLPNYCAPAEAQHRAPQRFSRSGDKVPMPEMRHGIIIV